MAAKPCLFCQIVSGAVDASRVFEDAASVAFLDHKPVFPGHVLLVPKQHVETLADLPPDLLQPLFGNAQAISSAVEHAMTAQGTFVAMNNRVSQSVPHLHIHIVPRTKGDGLRGFFWPRQKYRNASHMSEVRDAIAAALQS